MKTLHTHTKLLLFFVFAAVLFMKNIIFHWAAFHSVLFSSIWTSPLAFYKFYMAKLLMPLFIASFIFITKRYWWTILVSFLLDIWCISNLIYYKAYDLFLSVNDILLINNMGDAWSSVTTYLDSSVVYVISTTIVYVLYYSIQTACFKQVQKPNRNIIGFTISSFVVFALSYFNNYLIYNWEFKSTITDSKIEQEEWNELATEHDSTKKHNDKHLYYLPFYRIFSIANTDMWHRLWFVESDFIKEYIHDQSIISYFISVQVYHFFNKNLTGDVIPLHDNDVQLIKPLFSISNSKSCVPNNSLIIILVESLESWPLEHAIDKQNAMPFLMNFKKNNHVLYCDKITSQTLSGNSGDGQMIINTGLLPIQNGVACMSYCNNTYPNFAHFFPTSAIINPWPGIWNQDTMAVRYSYSQLKEPPKKSQWEDDQVLNTSLDLLLKTSSPFCLMSITVSTHSPFNRVKNEKIQTTAPPVLNRYLQCLNYTDSCIGKFLNVILSDSLLSQSTVVITGDHTIFKSSMLAEFNPWAKAQDLSIKSGRNYCPLIIYSPQLNGNTYVDDVCYQMDIFPTIIHLIGCNNYYWKGLGVNVLDSLARKNRIITEDEAYELSEKLIRSNYFKTYLNPRNKINMSNR